MKGKVLVYIREYPFEVESKDICPIARAREIDACKSEKVREEKFFAWKLLEYAIEENLAKSMTDINVCKVGDKWVTDEIYFSISHTSNVVAVAISNNPVGVDIELLDNKKFGKLKIANLLNNDEMDGFANYHISHIWTKKEAIFKLGDNKIFAPKKVGIDGAETVTDEIVVGGKKIVISVATTTKVAVELKLI